MIWPLILSLVMVLWTEPGASSPGAPIARRSLNDMAARRRSALDKTFLRFGRSDPLGLDDYAPQTNPIRRTALDSRDLPEGFVTRLGRAKQDSFLRYGRGKSQDFLRFGRVPADMHIRLGRPDHSFDHIGRFLPYREDFDDNAFSDGTFEKRKSSSFLRLGRPSSKNDQFLRLGRAPSSGEIVDPNLAERSAEDVKMVAKYPRARKWKDSTSDGFMRLGRSGQDTEDDDSLEDALEIDFPAESRRKRDATGTVAVASENRSH